jgi:transcriptional regulator with XRE-family HTH domain
MPPTERAKQLGRLIAKYRQAKGLSQRAAADLMGYHHSYLARLEGGDYEAPRPQQLKKMASVLDIPMEDLYALAGYQVEDRLPDFAPYLRAKYDLPTEAVERLDEYFQMLKERYGVGADEGDRDG